MSHRYAALGKQIYLWERDDGAQRKLRQVLWGDWLEIDENRASVDGFLPVIWAKNDPEKRRELWVREEETVDARPLEIIFVDVGQGDGCVLITPERDQDECIVVIDAGEDASMREFLDGRFGAYGDGFDFHAAVITHPDKDHYLGFRSIFENPAIGFRHVYHNGLMELPASRDWDKVGGLREDVAQEVTYVGRLWQTHEEVVDDFADASTFGRFRFPPVIHAAIANPKIDAIEMLSTAHGTLEDGRSFLPGFAPSDPPDYSIEVLGPVVEHDSDGEARLRKLGSYGKTKNGHSVLLRLQYGQFSLFFGGDLNRAAEQFLIRHYTGRERLPRRRGAEYDEVVGLARERFRSEVMKTCHHGAADVTDLFLDAVNPACFIISSGDEEGHVHPRPDLLGRLGRFGRGESPVLLSTELQRSTRALESAEEVGKLKRLVDRLAADPTVATAETLKAGIELLARNNVDVYGAIYVKTDGERLITAFKKETGSATDRWFYFEYLIDPSGTLSVSS